MASVFPLIIIIYIGYYIALGLYGLENRTLKLSEGMEYSRKFIPFNSKKAVIHIIKIDMNYVKISISTPSVVDTIIKNSAITTTEALLKYGADIAINGSFFTPFKDSHLFDYYPHRGDLVTPVGATFSGDKLYGLLSAEWPVFVVYKNDEVDIKSNTNGLYSDLNLKKPLVEYMLSGRSILIDNGIAIKNSDSTLYPRTAIGISKDQEVLWLFVVDGKQPFYSNGVSLNFLSDLMISTGVNKALELDGGGSATMAWVNPRTEKPELLNRPIHTKIPNRERPVANHILVYVK